MKSIVLAGLAASCFLPGLVAGPVEDAIVAAMRLSDRPNYTWVANVDDDARSYTITGRTSKAGYSLVRMPVVNAIRRRLGRSPTDNLIDAVFRGNVQCVIQTDEGWKTVDELPPVGDLEPLVGTDGLPVRGSILSGPGGKAGKAKILNVPKPEEDRPERGYSNLQMGLSHPHEELGVIVTSGKDLQVAGDPVTGTTLTGSLTELGAQLLLVRDGQTEITPLTGSGTFTLWIRGGIVTRYQVNLEGTLAIKTAAAVRQVSVRQTTSTLIKDVGTTKVEVPFEAKDKLGK
jgi:hypothetical protein